MGSRRARFAYWGGRSPAPCRLRERERPGPDDVVVLGEQFDQRTLVLRSHVPADERAEQRLGRRVAPGAPQGDSRAVEPELRRERQVGASLDVSRSFGKVRREVSVQRRAEFAQRLRVVRMRAPPDQRARDRLMVAKLRLSAASACDTSARRS